MSLEVRANFNHNNSFSVVNNYLQNSFVDKTMEMLRNKCNHATSF